MFAGWLLTASALVLPGAASPAPGASATAVPAARLVGVRVEPERVELRGSNALQTILVTGRYSDGNLRDLTPQARLTPARPGLVEVRGSQLRAQRDGEAMVTVAVPGAPAARLPVSVTETARPAPVSLRDDVIPALTKLGCNAGACHGTPNGKGGFRLSLQGYAPDFDFAQLALQGAGRRTNRVDPGSSLILLKSTAKVPHGGGRRLWETYPEFQVLTRWMAEGLRDDPRDHPAVERLEVTPAKRVLLKPARRQQLVVTATFADGTRRDVTPLVKFSSSDDSIANVSREGVVEAQHRGEVAVQCRYQHLVQSVRLTFIEPVPGFRWPNPPAANAIDRDVFAKLRLLQIPPSDLCTDPEFIRRVYLDALGILPTAEEVTQFLAECEVERASGVERLASASGPATPNAQRPGTREAGGPGARARLIDRVLARPEFADFWALKWADLLRVNEANLTPEGVKGYHRWLQESMAADRPMDQFVREMLTAQGAADEHPAANFYRATSEPENWMEVTAQVFMGVRISCARCHNHPFERWTQDEYYQLAAFFGQVQKRESGRRNNRTALISLDTGAEVIQPRTGRVMRPKFLGGPQPQIPADTDRRPYLAEWLTAKDNPFFARALANRVWFHVVGRGVVEPVDDFRDSNPPANDALLATLTQEFVRGGLRIRPLVRFIMNSRTYQLSARSNPLNRGDTLYSSHAVTRLMTAEQLLDAISAFTGVPEAFEGFPAGTRAAQLPGSQVSSPFLKTFGRPERTLSCECERESGSNLYQALQLITGRSLNDKLRSDTGRIAALAGSDRPPDAIVDELYLAALSRYPSPREREAARKHLAAGNRRAALEDLGWVLVNDKEFLFRH